MEKPHKPGHAYYTKSKFSSPVLVYVRPETRRRLKRIAKRRGIKLQALLRDALEGYKEH